MELERNAHGEKILIKASCFSLCWNCICLIPEVFPVSVSLCCLVETQIRIYVTIQVLLLHENGHHCSWGHYLTACATLYYLKKYFLLENMWSSSIMCTSAFTNAHEVSTSSPHPSPSSSMLPSLSLSPFDSLSHSQKHMPGPLKPSSSRDLDYFSTFPTPDSLKRFPQMLPHSTAFLYFPLIFWLCLSNLSAPIMWSIFKICLFLLKYISSHCCVLSKLIPLIKWKKVISFHGSHFFIFFNLLTLWCQLLLIQIVRALCETVTDLCKHKLGCVVDWWAPSQTEGCLSVWIIRYTEVASQTYTHRSTFTRNYTYTQIIWWNSNESVTSCPSSLSSENHCHS